jgi:Recombinase zinc beta ribbon domain
VKGRATRAMSTETLRLCNCASAQLRSCRHPGHRPQSRLKMLTEMIYYVCFSRQRYGRGTCDGDRLPAEELEDAILAQLLSVLEREPMVREAISSAFEELEAEQPRREAELSPSMQRRSGSANRSTATSAPSRRGRCPRRPARRGSRS